MRKVQKEEVDFTLKWLKQRVLLAASLLVYCAVIHFSYLYFISPTFGYMGLIYNQPQNPSFLAIGYGLAMSVALLLPWDVKKPSDIVMWFLAFCVVVPSNLIPTFTLSIPESEIITLQLGMLVSLIIFKLVLLLPQVDFAPPALSNELYWVLFASFAAFLYFQILYSFGLNLNLPSITDVYLVRADYKQQIQDLSGFVPYAVNWIEKVINPLVVIFGLLKRRPMLVFAGFAGQIIIFTTMASKGALFSTAFILLFYAFVKFVKSGRGPIILWTIIFGAIFCMCLDHFFDLDGWMVTLFVRRILVAPAQLSGYYYEFFSVNEPVMLAHSILKRFIEYPYGEGTPPLLIGYYYFPGFNASVNVNVFAEGFANFRFTGMFGAAGLLGVTFWLFDCLAKTFKNPVLFLTMTAILSFNIVEASFFSCLLTHGILLTFAILYYLPPSGTFEEPACKHS